MAKKKNSEILVIGRTIPGNLTRGNHAIEDAMKVGSISSDKLQSELKEITNCIGATLEKINSALKQYSLEEISIKLELTTEGKLGILGSGMSVSGTGGIDLKFKLNK